MEEKLVRVDNTNFLFATHFSGDPERDNYGSTKRYANLIIPTKEQADELAQMGLNVKVWEGREQTYYFLKVGVDYDHDWASPQSVMLVTNDNLESVNSKDKICILDNVRVKNVMSTLRIWWNRKASMYMADFKILYVEQDLVNDPYASRYARPAMNDEEGLPFN